MTTGELAIVLGGGKGTRLFPLTKQRSKPAVPIAGKYRLIDIPISNCINSGIHRIFVLTQFLTASLHRHVYETYKFDTFSKGFVEILPAEQTLTSADWYQGTADAVRRQQHRIDRIDPQNILILPGDHLYRMDFQQILRFHRDADSDVTISASCVPEAAISRYGLMRCRQDHRICEYIEKPDGSTDISGFRIGSGSDSSFLASMGIYACRADVLKEVLLQNPGQDFGRDILPRLIGSYRIHAYIFRDYWEDIGTISSFYNANLALTQKNPPFDFFDPGQPIYTRSRFLPHSYLDGTLVNQSLVSDGCRISNSRIEGSIIGLRSVIGSGSRLHRVVMMGADFYEDEDDRRRNHDAGIPNTGIGEDCSIERAILDKNVRIGKRVVIRSHVSEPDREADEYVLRDGIVIVPKGTVIPDGAEI